MNSLGSARYALGEPERAIACLRESLALAPRGGDRLEEAAAWTNLGRAHAALGEAEAALDAYERALALWQGVGDRPREAATLARLDSPHIVHILEYGEHDGLPYLVTQFVPGGDLRRHLEVCGPLPARRAADVAAQVAAGLDEAHFHGVVHRDLKPANVLLRTLPDGELHAYLCDFGIARGASDQTTSASGVLGTLEFLAPERQSGAPASVATTSTMGTTLD